MITSNEPSETKRETIPCPKCSGDAFHFGSSMMSWRCQACGATFDRDSSVASRRGYTPGVYDE
jgi:tRNA(Ile2) C34 agmatinyltransferase TiaS